MIQSKQSNSYLFPVIIKRREAAMRIVKQGYPFIFAALLLAVIAFAVFGIRIAVIPLVLIFSVIRNVS